MVYDEGLAQRVREIFIDQPGIQEKKMFGGIAFMLFGNMAVGVANEDLMVRVGTDEYEEALKKPHARKMDFTGRPMKGFVYVAMDGLDDEYLKYWVDLGRNYALSLPKK